MTRVYRRRSLKIRTRISFLSNTTIFTVIVFCFGKNSTIDDIQYEILILVVATCHKNVNVVIIQAFLYKLVGVFAEYFKDVEEESIRDNFVIIYELLDEMMDFGYPQTTEARILRESVCLYIL